MIGNNILETSTTTGTGDVTLDGAATNRATFASQFAVDEIVSYVIRHGADLEAGYGALSDSTTLQRLVVTYSTNSNALVSFGAGTKEVYCTPSAQLLRNGLVTRYVIPADTMLLPNSSDWVVNQPPVNGLVQDSSRSSLTVAQYTEASEQGQGYLIYVPPGATYATIRGTHRPETSPGGSPSSIQLAWYARSTTGSWTSALDLAPWPLAASSTAFQDASPETLSLSTLGLTADAVYTFEITRQPSDGDDPYSGVWNLLNYVLEIW